MTDNYDQLALSWVRKEINNTLEQARQGLETFADDSQDQTQIQFCINCLHQVQGTLQMLDFAGAARLAAEMEALAEKMASDSSFAVESAFEVLMRSLLQMPGYLERVEEGHKDIPVILLPLINELRAAGALAPISERELFSADTSGVVPPKAVEKVSEQDKTSSFQDNAKRLRAHFQKGLAGIIRGENIKESLSRIHKVLLRLEALTEETAVARLWWVADGFIFSITEGGRYKKKEVHQLLSQVDKRIKRLADEGTAAQNEVIPEKLLSQLLYFVARSSSKNARVASLKKEFNLESALSDSEQIKKRQEKLARPDSSAVTNVAGAINEELALVKDQLDLFVRQTVKDSSQLQSMVDSLNRIADTLTLLELAIPRDVVRQQTKHIQKLVDMGKVPDDSTIMDVAGALLFVEANLKNIDLEAVQTSADETESAAQSKSQAKETEVDEATYTLIKVARKSMQAAKDKMINYIATEFSSDALEEVPTILQEVIGGVKIIQFDDAAKILEVAKLFIEDRILGQSNPPKESQLDALADVITSVEYYLEASEERKQRGISSILKGAESSVALLKGVLAEATIEEPVEKRESVVEKAPTQIRDQGSEEKASTEAKAVPTAEVISIMPSAQKQADETLIDEEVLEIFLEEAEEEIEMINQMLPRWQHDTSDEEALTTLRRSFHTLKGSGRLVGAKVIGEVSWSIENILNKVIEESIPAEKNVQDLLVEAHKLLPSLVKAFSEQSPIADGYKKLIAKAEHIASGKAMSEFDYVEPAAVETPDTQVSAQEPEVEAIDPVLLEIFSTEAESHLNAIRDFLNKAPAEGTVAITDELIRALHTLKGSANMADVKSVADITAPWEKFARMAKGSGQRFDMPTVKLLAETQEYLSHSLEDLKSGRPVNQPQLKEIFDKVSQLSISSSTSGEASIKQRDQQLVSIFLTEGLDILHEVSSLNEDLEKDLTNQDKIEAIRSELHTFHRGSEMLAIEELQALAASAENLANSAASHKQLESSFSLLMIEVVEALTAMLNRIASEEDLLTPQATIEKIDQWIAGGEEASPAEDMDVELVELFVEEGEELIETARELFTRWKENLISKELNAELRRIYHTLKGSSRMAGAMAIGDLAYAAEDMFNTVVDQGRSQSPVEYQIIVDTTEKLESMIAELKRLSWPDAAPKEEQRIRDYLAGKPDTAESETVEEVESAPELTEISESVEATEQPEESLEIPELVEAVEIEEPGEETLEIPELTEAVSEDDEEVIEFTLPDEAVELVDAEETQESVEELDFGEASEDFVTAESEDELVIEAPVEETEEELEGEALETLAEEEVSEELATEAEELTTDDSGTEFKDDSLVSKRTEIEETLSEVVVPDADDLEEIAAQEEPVETVAAEEHEEAVSTADTIAPSAPQVVSDNVHTVDLDEDGEEVLEIYLEEAEELLVALDEALHEWSADLSNKPAIDLLQRTLHTFKGGARLSDLVVLGDLTHEMETYFERVNAGQLTPKKADVDFLLQGYDVIAGLIKEVSDERKMSVPVNYMQALERLISGESAVVETVEIEAPVEQKTEAEKASAEVVSFEKKKQEQTDAKAKAAQSTEVVRLPAEQLEGLVNLAGETSIFRSRLEQQMSVLKYNLEEMSSTIERLRDQLRNLDIETEAQVLYRREVSSGSDYEDFDPLEMDRYTRQQELTRGLGESAVDLMSLKETLDTLTSDSETLLLQQGRVNTEMQESLMRTRMTPFDSLVPRLRRMIRQISTELGKTIELSINAEGEMDRTVLERMIAPIEHMLRNAMDHGIESPEERKANSKPETGSIKISLFREGSEVFIKIQDDGRGLNLTAIRKKAIEKGLITTSTELSDHELQQLILEAGFSTAEQVTQISGRGVGMDVVSSEIKQMGGLIEIDSVQGVGSTFTVKLPFTVSVNQALMVQLGDEVFAIPLANIEGIVRVSPYELEEYYNNPDSHFDYAGIGYSMYYLGQLLDHDRQANVAGATQPLPVLLLHGADHPTALQVDELLGSREIVVKTLGSQLSSISGLSGATILGDGRVVFILDMPALIRRIDASISDELKVIVQEEEEKVPVVMVVDDSITVRKVTTRLLERHDFEVITAKDGVDALSVLGEQKPDVMLLDIEMPRMDGFELATIIRHDEALKDLPIIMITSRTGEKHRERAEQIGVNQYMGKPYNEVDLLDSISALLPNKA